jgi:hypothetical protein
MSRGHRRRSNRKLLGTKARLEREELGDVAYLSVAERARRLAQQRAAEQRLIPLRRPQRPR